MIIDQITLVSSKETSREEADLGVIALVMLSLVCIFKGGIRLDIFRNDDMTIDEDHLLLVQLFPGEMLCHTCLCASLQSICLGDVAVFTY